jgi:hypothetical protein
MGSVETMVGRAKDGTKSALDVVQFALDTGDYLAIGGVQRLRTHTISIPQSGTAPGGYRYDVERGWRMSAPNERGGAKLMVLAATIARPAVWSAISGNRNIPLERKTLRRELTPANRDYDFGTHGHYPSPEAEEGLGLAGHEDLLEALDRRKDKRRVLGGVSLIRLTDVTEIAATSLPDDVGHVGIAHAVPTAHFVPVRVGDYADLSISPIYYEPRRVNA